MIPPRRPPTYAMAFIVRIRCHAATRAMLDAWSRRPLPWKPEEARELADRYTNRQLDTLERDAQILACWGQTHAGAEA